MKVYIIYNSHSEQIEHVFAQWIDANNMLESLPHSDRYIEEHEVIE